MKIAVCFKIVPDYEEVSAGEWEDPASLDTTYVKKMYGCFDEAALEMALSLKDSCIRQNCPAEAVAVTAGAAEGAATMSLLRALYAEGFDEVVILPQTDPFDPMCTARTLASWLKENPADLIFIGKLVGPGESGAVPFYLAEELGCGIITDTVSARWNAEKEKAELERRNQSLEESVEVYDTCISVVGDTDHPYLRLFSVKARLEARQKTFAEIEGNGRQPLKTTLSELRPEAADAKSCCMVHADDPAKAAAFLLGQICGKEKE